MLSLAVQGAGASMEVAEGTALTLKGSPKEAGQGSRAENLGFATGFAWLWLFIHSFRLMSGCF